jgi:Zn-dependent alcohol dehydrogenase
VGADYVFECAGVAALAALGVEATRAGGSTVLVGAPPLEGKLELDPLVLFGISEKRLMGCFLGSCNSLRDIPRMVAMWQAGRLDLDALVTAHRPLDEINEAFADLAAGVGIRTVVDLL